MGIHEIDRHGPFEDLEDLDDLYENAPCGYISYAKNGMIVKVNQTLADWLRRPKSDILGAKFLDLLNVPGKIFFETHFAPLLRMQGFCNEIALDLVGEAGAATPMFANAVERRGDDGSLIFTRVTLFLARDRRRYERELLAARNAAEEARRKVAEMNATLEARVEQAVAERLRAESGLEAEKALGRLREQFVAILGHDLRNPVAAIRSAIRVLKREPQTEKSASVLDMMAHSADRMAQLISDMLDLARANRSGGMRIECTDCDLGAELFQVVEEIRTANTGREIAADIDLPGVIRCDPDRIAQLTSNLLANALSHGAQNKPVTLSAKWQGDRVVITVTNQGDPIPADIVGKLFQPYFREGACRSKDGLGLGLFICSEIAKAHGGALSVVSTEQETSFIFAMTPG